MDEGATDSKAEDQRVKSSVLRPGSMGKVDKGTSPLFIT